MHVFLIFDEDFETGELAKRLGNQPVTIHLFPLTSNFIIIEKIRRELVALNTSVILIESAKSINDEVIKMQKNILYWSSGIANARVGNKSIKEWMTLPDGSGSSWWYSILSEKNAVQETVFFRIAQINAIQARMQTHRFELCVTAVTDRRLRKILAELYQGKKFISLKPSVPKLGMKARIFAFIQQWGFTGAVLAALVNWIVWLRDSRLARRMLPDAASRARANNPLLFITYFPNVDNEAAQQGIFRNKYALALQDKLNELGTPVTWLLMPVYYNGHDFKSAMQLANQFARKGEKLFVLQEFFNVRVFLRSVYWWLQQSVLGIYLYARMDKKLLTDKLTHPAALPIIRYLWLHSFTGASGVRGIIFYLTWLQVFKQVRDIKTCLYYCEMQAWEKAFIHAKKQLSPGTRALAFQHTVVGRNYYNYFYDKSDLSQNASNTDFPAPDMLIANGGMMYDFLAESNYPNLCQAEAVRQLYLSKALRAPARTKTGRPVLFVAGSCDKVEMKSLITMLIAAFPAPTDFEVWIKASPVNPVEPLFAELGIDTVRAGYKILHQDVSQLISSAHVALVANTTVAIEAAANGCTVIVPVFADTMLMNPIIGTGALYELVSTVQELKAAVERNLQASAQAQDSSFIRQYWNINPDIPLWTNILSQTHYATHSNK